MIPQRLHEIIAAVCPILGVDLDAAGNPLGFRPTAAATAQQRSNGQAAFAGADTSQAADDAWLAAQNPDRKNLRDQATQAIVDIDTYLAIASPNNAQVVAQVRRLSQYSRALIKRLIQID